MHTHTHTWGWFKQHKSTLAKSNLLYQVIWLEKKILSVYFSTGNLKAVSCVCVLDVLKDGGVSLCLYELDDWTFACVCMCVCLSLHLGMCWRVYAVCKGSNVIECVSTPVPLQRGGAGATGVLLWYEGATTVTHGVFQQSRIKSNPFLYTQLHTHTHTHLLMETAIYTLLFLSLFIFSCPLLPLHLSWPTRRSTPASSGLFRRTTPWTPPWSSSSTSTNGAAWAPWPRTSSASQR